MRLKGKTAIVTGGAKGIGASTAKKFAAAGARVIVADIMEAGIDTVTEIDSLGGDARFFRLDVSQSEQVQALINYTIKEYGSLHIVCNNAAVNLPGTVESLTEEMWDRTMNVNLKSMYLTCKYGIPELRKAGGGSIINVGSANSFIAEKFLSAYVASKGGILMLTKAIALDYAKENIRANCICPGWLSTGFNDAHAALLGGLDHVLSSLADFQPIGRAIEPEEIANIALFLASDESSAMTGSAVVADGGVSAQ